MQSKHFKYIVGILLVAVTAFAATNNLPDLRIKPLATGSLPTGQEGQFATDSTTHHAKYKDNSAWRSMYTDADSSSSNSASKLVLRDSSGDFAAHDITGNSFIGPLTGTATNATNTGTTDDTTTNATMYPVWKTSTSGNLPEKVSSTKMTFNPSTGALTCTSFVGDLTGNASTATALAANPAACAANRFVTDTDANGTLTCTQPAFTDISGTAATTQGGTNLTSYTLGDTLYSSAANTLAKLAGNTSTVQKFLSQTGDGVNSAAPVWFQGSSAALASSVVLRDSNQSFTAGQINAVFAPNTTVLATSGVTTTLTSTSSQQYILTGSSTHTIKLPVVTTLQNGYYYRIVNLSTGQVTVQTSGTNTIQAMSANTEVLVTVKDTTAGTGTASWTSRYLSLSGGGGGGGGALKWVCADGLCPVPTQENEVQVYMYSNGIMQYLYTQIRVPTTYNAGSQINLKLPFYSPDSSNTVQFECVATLVRVGTDAITSTTNQRTSTNAATTLASANRVETQTCDLTDTSGQINSVAVAAGNIVRVRVTRKTNDTATSDARLIPDAAEVTFQ